MKNKIEEILDKIWKEIGGIKGEITEIKGEITEIKETMATKKQLSFFKDYFDERIDRVEEKMATKDMLDRHMALMDKSSEIAKQAQRSRLLYEKQFSDISDQVADHENRLKSIGA